jgi:hypothetical protein
MQPLRLREALREFHDAYERANSAPLDSPAFREAMADLRRLSAELRSLGLDDPLGSWRAPERRVLGGPTRAR